MTDITELPQSLKRRATSANEFGESLYVKGDDIIELVEVLEKAQQRIYELEYDEVVNGWLTQSTNSTWLYWLSITSNSAAKLSCI